MNRIALTLAATFVLAGSLVIVGVGDRPPTLTERCVQGIEALHVEHGVAFTLEISERGPRCDAWMQQNGITTHEDLEEALSVADATADAAQQAAGN